MDERRQLNWVVRQDENRSDSLEIPMTAVGPNAQPLYSATEAVTLPPEAAATGSSTARETLVRSSTWVLNSSVSFERYSLRDDRRVLQTASSLGISMVPR